MADDNPIRARIVEAAINCIQREGVEAVTSRSIAKEAGVNGAALNYYFGSKERVLELALDRAMTSAFVDPIDDFDRFVERHGDLRQAMIALLDETIEGAMRFPNVAFALIHEPASRQRYDGAAILKINAFLEKLFERVDPVLRGDTAPRRRAALAQLWSSVLLAGILPHAFDRYLGSNLSDAKTRLDYIRSMVDCHLRDDTSDVTRTKKKRS